MSVRTLHYYDEIGLLKPSDVEKQNGYCFYDGSSLERLIKALEVTENGRGNMNLKEFDNSEYEKTKARNNRAFKFIHSP